MKNDDILTHLHIIHAFVSSVNLILEKNGGDLRVHRRRFSCCYVLLKIVPKLRWIVVQTVDKPVLMIDLLQ